MRRAVDQRIEDTEAVCYQYSDREITREQAEHQLMGLGYDPGEIFELLDPATPSAREVAADLRKGE